MRREVKGVGRRSGSLGPLELYLEAASAEAPWGKEERYLGRRYARELRIKKSDAYHLALAVAGAVDVFVSWNRQDLVKRQTKVELHWLNQALGRRTPSIMTPLELLQSTRRDQNRGRLIEP